MRRYSFISRLGIMLLLGVFIFNANLFNGSIRVIAFSAALSSVTPSEDKIPDGTIVRERASGRSYLMVKGQKWRISDGFTYRQIALPGQRALIKDKSFLDAIPSGETLKISLPKISGIYDLHEHYRVGGNMKMYLSVAKKLGIIKTVFLPTGDSPDNRGYKMHMAELLRQYKKYPDSIIPFCTIDEADTNSPQIFSDCLDHGGKGLKILGGHPSMYDTPLDNEAMQQVFAIANERDVPVLVHVSITTLPTAKAEFIHLMDMFPDTRVQFAHLCTAALYGDDLDQCAAFLDKYPNMIADLAMGGGFESFYRILNKKFAAETVGEQPGTRWTGLDLVKKFIIKYQDRIVFGTDVILLPSGPTINADYVERRMMCDISLLQEKWFRCPLVNNKGEYTLLPGFNFSDDVLKKIWVENPKEFLKI